MAITKEVLDGIIKHEEEVKGEWAKAYKKAVDEDNGEAIFILLKSAPKVKRASDVAVRIKKNMEGYVMADRQSSEPFKATGDVETDLSYATARSSVARKASSVRKFILSVENL